MVPSWSKLESLLKQPCLAAAIPPVATAVISGEESPSAPRLTRTIRSPRRNPWLVLASTIKGVAIITTTAICTVSDGSNIKRRLGGSRNWFQFWSWLPTMFYWGVPVVASTISGIEDSEFRFHSTCTNISKQKLDQIELLSYTSYPN